MKPYAEPRKMPIHPLTLWRLQRRLTQDQFVDLVLERHPETRLSQGYLSMIENGRKVPSEKIALAISDTIRREASAKFIREQSVRMMRYRKRNGTRQRG